MLTAEENERLTRVGPGTPMGRLLRWYWHPIAATAQLVDNPVRKVRILGEDLVLFQDRSGNLGLIGDRCAHRSTGLWYGIPDADGLRCPYHGWKYDATGQCIDQPLEPPGSTYKDRIKIKSYPVQEMGGLIWAYLGELPAPLLPRWDLFARPNRFRQIAATMLPCNWLQCLDNGGDPNHETYLHGHFFRYVIERARDLGRPLNLNEDTFQFLEREFHILPPAPDWDGTITDEMRHEYREIRPEPWEYGQRKYMVRLRPVKDGVEKVWAEHQVVVFPYIRGPQMGVPIDDTHTWHIAYHSYSPDPSIEVPKQDVIPYFEPPWRFENGEPNFSYILAQDELGWWSQGEITDRANEHLGTSDVAVIALRKLLMEQLEIVENGGQPMNVFWDRKAEDEGGCIPMIPGGRERPPGPPGETGGRGDVITAVNFSPVWDQYWDLMQRDRAARAARSEDAVQATPLGRIVDCACCAPPR